MIQRIFKVSLYNCPWLEEVQLQDNRLTSLPAAVFTLESLSSLDVSNNKLQSLPFAVWDAPALKELNLAFNLLTELPVGVEELPMPTPPPGMASSEVRWKSIKKDLTVV